MRGPDRESSEGVEERGMGRGIIYRVLCSCTQKNYINAEKSVPVTSH